MPIDRHIGVDGCKAGWFFIAIGPGDEFEFGIFSTIKTYFPRKRKASFLEFIFEFILTTKPTSNIDALQYSAVSI
jgi:hypothetical protein